MHLFYLGTHETGWLRSAGVPLFVSRRRLTKRKSFPRAAGRWALDSGGFTELSTYGRWTVTAADYIREARLYSSEVGRMDWAAQQDWMCEPFILEKTGRTVADHQELTTQNYLRLTEAAPDVRWAPVLQGWLPEDYRRHADQFEAAGVDLAALPVVGVGSVCRRQGMAVARLILQPLAERGYRLHGFGFKKRGLSLAADLLASSDSMAWSYNARRNPPLPGCTHKSCSNCLRWALRWRAGMLTEMAGPEQPDLPRVHG